MISLDTHALLWWFADDPALPQQAETLIDDPSNIVLVSAASAWEVCTKVRIGKLPTGQALCDDFSGYLQGVPLATNDPAFAGFGVRVLW